MMNRLRAMTLGESATDSVGKPTKTGGIKALNSMLESEKKLEAMAMGYLQSDLIIGTSQAEFAKGQVVDFHTMLEEIQQGTYEAQMSVQKYEKARQKTTAMFNEIVERNKESEKLWKKLKSARSDAESAAKSKKGDIDGKAAETLTEVEAEVAADDEKLKEWNAKKLKAVLIAKGELMLQYHVVELRRAENDWDLIHNLEVTVQPTDEEEKLALSSSELAARASASDGPAKDEDPSDDDDDGPKLIVPAAVRGASPSMPSGPPPAGRPKPSVVAREPEAAADVDDGMDGIVDNDEDFEAENANGEDDATEEV